MTTQYHLHIMDRAYSSWSLRGHLLFEPFGLSCRTTQADWPSDEWRAMLELFATGEAPA